MQHIIFLALLFSFCVFIAILRSLLMDVSENDPVFAAPGALCRGLWSVRVGTGLCRADHLQEPPSAPPFCLPVLWWVLLHHCSHCLYYYESFCITVLTTCTMVSPAAPLFWLHVLWWVLMHSCSCYLHYGESCYNTVLSTCAVVSSDAQLFLLPVLWWVLLHHCSHYRFCYGRRVLNYCSDSDGTTLHCLSSAMMNLWHY